ncbi:FKBP-type peptidyl-prolyl cis-trans isomerase [Pontibacter sp. JAM-7]|uniref:FKBP-type peptidyl-prolyl cis-trans isomerase n=1 Tax=Pontibacter sp. JAM-7 TaxID=3366581 RepID=UPI003AF6584C
MRNQTFHRLGWILGLVLVLLAGCGENPEEEAFRQQLKDKALNDDTRKLGEAFLQENAQQPGVKVTVSGLQYRIEQPGEGPHPGITDLVTVHYEGTRVDGGVFDSSYQRGEPSTFPLNRVIRGWTEAVGMMNRGAVWTLFIPPELAYGATSPSDQIPANSTLIFKVELVDFQPAQ